MEARPGGFGSPSVTGQVLPASSPAPVPAPGTIEAVEVQLARLPGLAVADHVEVFAVIHGQLTEALAATGGGQVGGAQGGGAHQQPGRHQPFQRGR